MTPADLKTQALAFVQNNRPAEAERCYRQALALAPDDHEAHFGLANLLLGMGRHQEAVACYQQAIRCQPAHAEAYNNQGVALNNLGRYDAAVASYRQALSLKPDYALAWNNLGNSLAALKQWAEAEQAFNKALELRPDYVEAHNSLGIAFAQQGLLTEAIACYRRALKLRPNNAEVYNNLGLAYHGLHQYQEALNCFLDARALRPGYAKACFNAGLTLEAQQRLTEAIELYQEALRLDPGLQPARLQLADALQAQGQPDEALRIAQSAVQSNPLDVRAHFCLGKLLLAQRQYDAAADAYREVLRLDPRHASAWHSLGIVHIVRGEMVEAAAALRQALDFGHDPAETHHNLGAALLSLDQTAEAESCYRRSIELRPDNADTRTALGQVLTRLGRLREALVCYDDALALDPRSVDAHVNLAGLLREYGRFDESIAHYREALTLGPGSARAYSNLLFTLSYHPTLSAREISEEHRRWGTLHAATRADLPAPCPRADPGRRLRVGYVSPDFRAHAVSTFIEPVLARHDPAGVEIFCYAEMANAAADATTVRLQALAGHWRNTRGLSDLEMATRIRQDGIDILVDLAGHTAGNRLSAFAYKPAPIQVSYLGYVNTTGLPAMDYRLTDRWADPENSAGLYTEQLARLPDAFFCYDPPQAAPPVGPLPAASAGYVTFGSFNRLSKINERVLGCWAEILAAVPRSRLLLQAHSFNEAEVQKQMREFFAQRGVESERLMLRPSTGFEDYLKAHHAVDLALDTFPHAGHTVTVHALWMGVPVVTLAGDRYAGRMGVSVLANLGLAHLIAESESDYVHKAVQLAADLGHLAELRAGLRERMRASSLMDAARFTRNLEAAYREIWNTWCSQTPREF